MKDGDQYTCADCLQNGSPHKTHVGVRRRDMANFVFPAILEGPNFSALVARKRTRRPRSHQRKLVGNNIENTHKKFRAVSL